MLRGLLVGALALTVACGTGSEDRTEQAEDLALITRAEVQRVEAPGLEVAVRFSDGQTWIQQFGVADLDGEEPLEPGQTWPLRSITKSFTVNALHQLADEGILSLDDTVDQYVGGVQGGDQITLLQLADMSSGLPEYANEQFVEVFEVDPTRQFTDIELMQFISGQPLDFEPGEEDVYTNTNTLLLGLVIESATGRPASDVIEQLILDPLGLDATSYAPDTAEVADAVPTGYQPDGSDLAPTPLTFGVFGGSGAMASTIGDLLDWGPALATGELLEDGGEFQRRNARPLDEGPEYDSYGVGIGEIDGWWGHTGEGLGYTSLVMHEDDSDTTVAITANISGLDEHLPTTLFRRFARLLAPG